MATKPTAAQANLRAADFLSLQRCALCKGFLSPDGCTMITFESDDPPLADKVCDVFDPLSVSPGELEG